MDAKTVKSTHRSENSGFQSSKHASNSTSLVQTPPSQNITNFKKRDSRELSSDEEDNFLTKKSPTDTHPKNTDSESSVRYNNMSKNSFTHMPYSNQNSNQNYRCNHNKNKNKPFVNNRYDHNGNNKKITHNGHRDNNQSYQHSSQSYNHRNQFFN